MESEGSGPQPTNEAKPCGCDEEEPLLHHYDPYALANRADNATFAAEMARSTAEAALILAGAALAFALAVYFGRAVSGTR